MKIILTFLTGFFLMIGSAISGKPLIKQKTLIPSIILSITPQQIEQVQDIPEIEEISTLETGIDDLPDFDIELSLE